MQAFEHLSPEQIQVIEKARQRVVESIGNNMDLYGVTLSVGHLYGNMYFRDNPVTLDEMSELMGMSKTSMSTGMRTLLDLEMIHKVWSKGSRKDRYEVVDDWHQNFIDYFSIKWRKSTEMNMNAIQRSLAELAVLRTRYPDDEQLGRVLDDDVSRLESAIRYYKWLNRLIDSMESGQIFDWVPKEEEPG